MISQPKGTAGLTPAEFYSTTRELLIDARRDRDEAKHALSDDRQEDLLELYAAAMSACGAFAP